MALSSIFLLTADHHLVEHWSHLVTPSLVVVHIDSVEQISNDQGKAVLVVDVDQINWKDPRWVQTFQTNNSMVISCYPNDTEGQQAFVLGARAYLHAYASVDLMRQALHQVMQNQIWLGESLLSRLLSQISQKLPMQLSWQQSLTPREIDIAQRAALGHSNQLIANDLGITERTVRAHLGSVFTKLDVSDRLMLALKVHGIN